MKFTKPSLLCAVWILTLFGSPDSAGDAGRREVYTFRGRTLEETTNEVHESLGKVFLWGADVPLRQKKVTFDPPPVLDNPVAYFQLYKALLESGGYVLVSQEWRCSSNVYKIFPSKLGITRAGSLYPPVPPKWPRYVYRYMELRYSSAEAVANEMTPTIREVGAVKPVGDKGLLLFGDVGVLEIEARIVDVRLSCAR